MTPHYHEAEKDYLVIKIKDFPRHQQDLIRRIVAELKIPSVKSIVIEKDWHEYEEVLLLFKENRKLRLEKELEEVRKTYSGTLLRDTNPSSLNHKSIVELYERGHEFDSNLTKCVKCDCSCIDLFEDEVYGGYRSCEPLSKEDRSLGEN